MAGSGNAVVSGENLSWRYLSGIVCIWWLYVRSSGLSHLHARMECLLLKLAIGTRVCSLFKTRHNSRVMLFMYGSVTPTSPKPSGHTRYQPFRRNRMFSQKNLCISCMLFLSGKDWISPVTFNYIKWEAHSQHSFPWSILACVYLLWLYVCLLAILAGRLQALLNCYHPQAHPANVRPLHINLAKSVTVFTDYDQSVIC